MCNSNLATLRVHQVDPPGSIYGLKACKVVLWGRLTMVRKKVVYPKESPESCVNCALHSTTKTQNRDLRRKPGEHMTLNNPQNEGDPLVKTFYIVAYGF